MQKPRACKQGIACNVTNVQSNLAEGCIAILSLLMAMNMQKIPFPCGISGPQLIHVFMYPHKSAPNAISISSAVFVQVTRVPNTQTDIQTTVRATSKCRRCGL